MLKEERTEKIKKKCYWERKEKIKKYDKRERREDTEFFTEGETRRSRKRAIGEKKKIRKMKR